MLNRLLKLSAIALSCGILATTVSGCANQKEIRTTPTSEEELIKSLKDSFNFEESKRELGYFSPTSKDLNNTYLGLGDGRLFDTLKIIGGYKTKVGVFCNQTLITGIIYRNNRWEINDNWHTPTKTLSDFKWIQAPDKYITSHNSPYIYKFLLPLRGIISKADNTFDRHLTIHKSDRYAVFAPTPYYSAETRKCHPDGFCSYKFHLEHEKNIAELAYTSGRQLYLFNPLDSLVFSIKSGEKVVQEISQGDKVSERMLKQFYKSYKDYISSEYVTVPFKGNFNSFKANYVYNDNSNFNQNYILNKVYDNPHHFWNKHFEIGDIILAEDAIFREELQLLEASKNNYTFKYTYKDKNGLSNTVTQKFYLKIGDTFKIGNLTLKLWSKNNFIEFNKKKIGIILKLININTNTHTEFENIPLDNAKTSLTEESSAISFINGEYYK